MTIPTADPAPRDSTAAAPAALPPLLVRRREAARLCGVSPAAWDRLVSSGRTPAPIRLGSAVLWSVEELRAWIAAGCADRRTWEVLRAAADKK
ncbi:MAG: helix-turn-helix transcriptional regulator [Candidatus Dormibacteria bacterium]